MRFRSCALDLWALMHVMDPRPDGTLKDNLATYTGRTRKQARMHVVICCDRLTCKRSACSNGQHCPKFLSRVHIIDGIPPAQVTDWFTNWRARHWKTVVQGIGMSLDQQGAISNDEGLHVASEEE
eukprot:1160039-Pelagomonas_calceolata.AAC.2